MGRGMFDTMTLTKTLGAVCGALLIFLLGGLAAESIYHVGGGHGDDHSQGYLIAVDDGSEPAEDVVEVPFADVFATADASAGERVFRQCSACHKLEDGENGVGPHLYGVVGREVGSVDGFGSYSGALSAVADVWSPENLNGFLERPSAWAPGTSMGYSGLAKVEDRANLIAYLQQAGG
jgi:cytochrome c